MSPTTSQFAIHPNLATIVRGLFPEFTSLGAQAALDQHRATLSQDVTGLYALDQLIETIAFNRDAELIADGSTLWELFDHLIATGLVSTPTDIEPGTVLVETDSNPASDGTFTVSFAGAGRLARVSRSEDTKWLLRPSDEASSHPDEKAPPLMTAIRAVVFELNGLLTNYRRDQQETLAEAAPALADALDALAQFDDEWANLPCGDMDAIAALLALHGRQDEAARVLACHVASDGPGDLHAAIRFGTDPAGASGIDRTWDEVLAAAAAYMSAG